jgi:hypothetical protein
MGDIDELATASTARRSAITETPELSPLKSQLLAALKLAKPEIGKEYLYLRCVHKYVDAMIPAISAAIANSQHVAEFAFRQSDMREAIGTIGKRQQYIYQLMKSDSRTSLLVVIRKGFRKEGLSALSTVALNPIYKELVMEELLNLRIESNQALLADIERSANYAVSVDPASLASYIRKTAETLGTTAKGDAYRDKLHRYLAAARQLHSMIQPADAANATPYIRERWELADSGRIYGQGYSLQRMPKEVRHAALGVCHKYDFKASAFALMAGLAHAIDPTLRVSAILEYVKDRQIIRQRIARELGIGEDLVKTIFTALGFGAELKNNPYNAIRGALARAARMRHDPTERLPRHIYNNLGAEEFQRLAENQTFAYIYEELQEVNHAILAYFEVNPLVIGENTYSDRDPKTGKQRNDRQKLAWIYQALESQAMLEFVDLVDQEPLLTTHDCLYFKTKLPASTVADAAYLLQQRFPYLRFEHEAIYPIVDDVQFAARSAEKERFEIQHRQCIAEEEQRAARHAFLRASQIRQNSSTTSHTTL